MARFSVCIIYEACRLVFLFYSFIYFLCGVVLRVPLRGRWGDPSGIYSASSFLLGVGVGRLWRFSAFVAFMRYAG